MEITLEKNKNNAGLKGSVRAISISKRKGIPKSNINSANLIKEHGIEGDIHAGSWHRQISLLSMESINKMISAGLTKLRPGIFAENITTDKIDLSSLVKGSRIMIGNAVLEITQIGKECVEKCAIYYHAGDCVMPKEGIFAKVIKAGTIEVGDNIEILDQDD